jgi:hypothetical protein
MNFRQDNGMYFIQGSAKAGHLGRFFGPDVAQRLGQKSLDPAQPKPSKIMFQLSSGKEKLAQRLRQAKK